MRETWTFHTAGQIIFGPGAVRQIGDVARRLKLNRLLIVTDGALERAGVVGAVVEPLAAAGIACEVFPGGEPEPSLAVAACCAAAAREIKPDGLVGLGGGSNMDLAKITAAMFTHGGTARDYIGDSKIPGPILPLICVPTTAGTGSEVSGSGVLTDEENDLKVGVMSNYLRPRVSIVDPRLTLSCPKKVTADSGIDALTHAIEAFTAIDNEVFGIETYPLADGETTIYQGRHPLGDCLAEKAISLIGANLERAVHEPSNPAAREAMALGALLAGMAFSNVGVALVHALEYPLGGATHCSHGEGNGLLLPYVMRFNLPVRSARFAQVARLLGEDIRGLDEHAAAERSVAAVERINRSIGIAPRLRDLGARAEQLPVFAEKALGIKRLLRVNCRAATLDDMLAIFQAAF